jgi:6,7-dimethyl-8-ribityllumazine synthase
MSLAAPQGKTVNGAAFSVGIAAACFNAALVDALVERVQAVLAAAGVKAKRITLVRVPGSHELPVAAQWLARGKQPDVVIALGVLIGGDTNHHEMVGQTVAQAFQQVALATGVAVINGVIVTDNLKQARARCTGPIDRGAEFARAALAMAALRRTLGKRS